MATAFEEYLPRLVDSGAELLATELRALSNLTPAQGQQLAKVWRRIPVAKRRRVVELMAELVEDNVELDFNDVFKIAMHDPDDEVRRRSAEGLWEDADLSTADLLVKVLRQDASPDVRAAAGASLGHFVMDYELGNVDQRTGQRITGALFQTVENEAEPLDVRRRAVESVGYLSTQRARDAIARAYGDAALKMRASAVYAMGRSCDRVWLPAVLAELQSESAELRFEAARASGELEDRRAVPHLVKLLRDADREVRVAAITSLGQIGGPEAKQVLRHLLASSDEELAEAAGEAIEELEANENPLHFHTSQIEDRQ